MGGSINNEKDSQIKQRATIKSENERLISNSKDFPNCKGLYPDCPEKPDLTTSMCRTCPKTDGIKKPRIGED
ncbi:MAG TPA: hypothetical protein PLI99_01245 [archaeon]|nr:hypothetical protein [archaeon]